jgi:tetratricopeptide (TPR) repeat protein
MLGGSSVEKPKRPCGACGKLDAPVRCPCKAESYCGAKCQQASWKRHKEGCTVFLSEDLGSKRTVLGDDHFEVGSANMDVGRICLDQGQYEVAERSFLEAGRIFRLVYGEVSARHAQTLQHLGGVYHHQGKYEVSRKMYKDALLINQHLELHLDEADCLVSIGVLDTCVGKFNKAVEKFTAARRIHDDHPADNLSPASVSGRVNVLNNLGVLHGRGGEHDKAFECLDQALRTWTLITDPQYARNRDDGVAFALLNMAGILFEQECLDQALIKIDEALPLLRRLHGEKSPEAATALIQLGDIYRKQGKFDQSLNVYSKALRHRQRAVGKSHIDVATTMQRVANLHMDQEHFDEALVLLECAERIQRDVCGNDSVEVVDTCVGISQCCKKLGDNLKWYATMREALRIRALSGTTDEVIRHVETLQEWDRLRDTVLNPGLEGGD